MKQLALLAITLFLGIVSSAAITTQAPNSQEPEYIKTKVFVTMTAGEFEAATGKKLSLFQKMYFKKLQRKLVRSKYQEDATILNHYDLQKEKFKFDLLWFIIGSLIGPFGLLFSYTADNSNRNKRISAAIGLGVFILWFGWAFLF